MPDIENPLMNGMIELEAIDDVSIERRDLFRGAGTLAAFLAAANRSAAQATEPDGRMPEAKPGPVLPLVPFGKHRITRLVAGANPVYGYSHFNYVFSAHMGEYHTTEGVLSFLRELENPLGRVVFPHVGGEDVVEVGIAVDGIRARDESGDPVLAEWNQRQHRPRLRFGHPPVRLGCLCGGAVGGGEECRQRTGAAEQVTALCRAIHSWLGCIWRLVEGVAAMMMFVSRIVASVPASHTPRPPPPVAHPSYPFAADCATLLSG